MKIYAVSDLHGNLDGLDPSDADLVVIAGDLAQKARRWFHEYGISLEQGAVMFIEEFVRAKGDVDKSAIATTERMQRIRNSSPQF